MLKPARIDEGFTLVELTIVLLISAIVLTMGTGALISMNNASNRDDSLVQEEQAASSAMAQMERDIRSAANLSIPAGAVAADELQVGILGPAGTTTNVIWKYDTATRVITRQVQSQGSYQSTGYTVTRVSNGTSVPVFTYYNGDAANISGTSPSNIALCATGVGIQIDLSPNTSGVASYQESAEVAITNQVDALTTPGNGQC
jgi:prepilin-type N-terminal cleavage/methylation domain-containing protein